jgi:hypothetical protein
MEQLRIIKIRSDLDKFRTANFTDDLFPYVGLKSHGQHAKDCSQAIPDPQWQIALLFSSVPSSARLNMCEALPNPATNEL